MKNLEQCSKEERRAVAARIRLGETIPGETQPPLWLGCSAGIAGWGILDTYYFLHEDFVARFGANGVWDDILHWLEK